MKGIVLAGGTGSRLYPLTKVTNKHLLPVGRKPMIYYPIEKLTKAGIEDILIVTGIEHIGDVVDLLGSGKEFGCDFTYRVQDEAGGIAQALGLAKSFVHGGRCTVILGDNLFEDSLIDEIEIFKKQPTGARILFKDVPDPHRFGVGDIQGDELLRIIEKPKDPPTPYAVTGVYFYDSEVFEVIKTLKPSARGELEITDVNNYYLERKALSWGFLKGWWSDAGTFESLARVQQLL